ncbi:Anthranilate phosphoribosyltransferase [Desulfovibrio sp. X2]|uniref:anthranilate phosphoribosyltransferase n=1 Tax=Desulfovibrio sp. X2 TaxID=941449 RepID=UPI000358B36D|nr:anthranilate phosphoribosyltransferase [Desulfovibrio sp. X2]EPR36306.1 Anthranilate phosphoribosyltransferase [Desulfovibrio sp. X2]
MAEIREILETLAKRRDLTAEQAGGAFAGLLAGEMSPAQAGAFLMGLRAKGATAEELSAGVEACLGEARLVPNLSGPRIDTCGTGGDCRNSFNCSTAVALTLAAMGHKVVKHGNRSVSSSCGSADILEAMGIRLDLPPEEVAAELERTGFVFLFAPAYHPAFKHVVPIRRELAIPTVFNVMGPLLNPARPTHQLLGVADQTLMPLMAEVLARSGVTRAAVVHGAEGFDEVTPFGPSRVLWVENGTVREDCIDPAKLGLGGGRPSDVSVAGPDEALCAMRDLLSGQGHIIMQHMLMLNLAVALYVLGDAPDLETAAMQARAAVFEGAAGRRFEVA